MRRWPVVVMSLVALLAGASQAAAQEEEQGGEIVPDTIAPDPSATSAAPPIVTEPPATTLPPGCALPPPPYATFVGDALGIGPLTEGSTEQLVQFSVVEVVDGTLTGFSSDADRRVNVYFGRDFRFLKVGERYIVAAEVDSAAGWLVSKARVRPPLFGDNQVVGVNDGVTCPKFPDPVVTKLGDGTPIDVGVLSPMLADRRKIGMAFARPAGLAMAALIGLVVVKHLLIALGRLIKRLARGTNQKAAGHQTAARSTGSPAGPEGQPERRSTQELSPH